MSEQPEFQEIRDLVSVEGRLPSTLFLIPVQLGPVYPGMVAPLVLTKPKLIETLDAVVSNRGYLGLSLMCNTEDVDPASTNVIKSADGLFYRVGTIAKVVKKLNTSEGNVTVLVQSLKRFEVKKIVRESPYIVAQVEYIEDQPQKGLEIDALTREVISQVKKLSEHNPFFTEEMKMAMVNAPGAAAVADLVAFALSLKKTDAQDFLETTDVKQKFEKLLLFLKREHELSDIQKKINEEVNQKIHKLQRDFFLKEQLRTIKKELGGDQDLKNVESYKAKIEQAKFGPEAKKVALEELSRLESTPDGSPEFNVIRNYLDWMLQLPWGVSTEDLLDLKKARKILDEDHYGIAKIKQRILEFLAVRKLNPKSKGSIICLVGPPGVGKTSLGKSIARAMGRGFFRFSLGGMRDEAEIKGHRRTYVGAMPGKILNALKRVGTENPVLMLDEVDKLGASFQGDPASALLEVLDPEQNTGFLDHYLDVPFDLSKVLFIVTANTTSTIPAPLLDRMEVIEISGYTLEEKQEIAKYHVIPKELTTHGLNPGFLSFPKETLEAIMLKYCREPGMRSFQQKIASICRKVALQVIENPNLKKIIIHSKDLYKYLGPEIFTNELSHRVDRPGVVTGLAWTSMGGDVLFIEASDVPKKLGSKHLKKHTKETNGIDTDSYGTLRLTGQLGDVMNESAQIAYSYVKKKTKLDKNARKFFEKNDIHLHVPAGAIPKDGPSAGVTLATALLSLVTKRRLKNKLAMTGELSLVGKVLPVGGIREKVLAAKRAGIKTVILSKQNKKDLLEVPQKNLTGLKFVFVNNIEQVFDAALI